MEELQRFLEDEGLLTVSFDPKKGRCLIANKDFRPGEVIIREQPYVCGPVSLSSGSFPVCEGCFKTSNLQKCSACQAVWYCGSACQRFDWKMHRLQCQAISRLDKNWRKFVTPEICLMVKLCLRRKLQREKIIPTTAIDNYKLVETLVAHMSTINPQRLLLYTEMAEVVKLMLQWPDINVKETIENFAKLSCNSHTITGNRMEPLGHGLYLVISIINHSCSPNSVLVFDGREAVIRAVQHVRKGDEVFISYIDIGSGCTLPRQKDLLKLYSFTCTCSRCLSGDTVHDELFEAPKCKNDKCSGFLVSKYGMTKSLCNQCGLARSLKDASEFLRKMASLTKKADMASDVHEALPIHKKTEELVKGFYSTSSISMLRIQNILLKDYIKLGDMQKALEYCRLTVPTYQRVYGVYAGLHPVLGLRYYTCGKLEWINGNKDIAVDFLNKAVDILQYTHGRETPFMKDLFEKLEKARSGAPCEFSTADFRNTHYLIT